MENTDWVSSEPLREFTVTYPRSQRGISALRPDLMHNLLRTAFCV